MDTSEHAAIWAGNPASIAVLEGQYAAYPSRYLVPYIRALYSFRHVPLAPYRTTLIGLQGAMHHYARHLLDLSRNYYVSNFPDRADVLSTILLWMHHVHPHAQQNAAIARELCLAAVAHLTDRGNRWAAIERYADHTEPLIRLTLADIYRLEKRYGEFRAELTKVELLAHRITDARQRSRVFRKLGMLLRADGSSVGGIWFGVRACFLAGIPVAVRMKSVAALIGIAR